jgi:hypothetical protein
MHSFDVAALQHLSTHIHPVQFLFIHCNEQEGVGPVSPAGMLHIAVTHMSWDGSMQTIKVFWAPCRLLVYLRRSNATARTPDA